MAATRVLVIEDDERVAAFVRRGLEEEAYVVDVASDGETGLAHALRDHVDLMVLDVMLPGMSGFEVLRRLRREGRRMPVLLLTARNARRDVVEGLDAGADDYLTKPFDFEELLARLRALTRRAHPPDETLLRFADVELNRLDRVARRGEQVLPLTPTEFRLLEVMMVEPEAVISRTELLERVWGMRFDPGTSLIDVHTANLRRKLEGGGGGPES